MIAILVFFDVMYTVNIAPDLLFMYEGYSFGHVGTMCP